MGRWNINLTIVEGNLTRDAELKHLSSGTAVSGFDIAVNGKPNQSGESKPSFFQVTLWGKIAETLTPYLKKGKGVIVQGHLEQSAWTTQDGDKRSKVILVAERVQFQPDGKAAGKSARTTEGYEPPIDDHFYDNAGFTPGPVDPNEPGF